MDTPVNSPVQLVQELLALLATRTEVCDTLIQKLTDQGQINSLQSAKDQTERFKGELLDELSGFGDAVASEVDRRNEYMENWIRVKQDASQTDGSRVIYLWESLEEDFAETFGRTIKDTTAVPDTLHEIINRQLQELNVK